MLVELASADDTIGAVDISLEQSRAEQLVAANRLYRQTAVSTGDARMAALLDELERVLVDIAASPAAAEGRDPGTGDADDRRVVRVCSLQFAVCSLQFAVFRETTT